MTLTFDQAKEKADYKQKHEKEMLKLMDNYANKRHKRTMAELKIKLKIAKTETIKQLEINNQERKNG